MMRFATLLLAAIAFAGPTLADEPPVVVLDGSSASATPWYSVPLYCLPLTYGPSFRRQHLAPSARRNR